ncbi:hypothetical protein B0H14DRAFT_3507280 [Mycena olivaceomarginata]|nr:hypothetical protein B0H14DRAFT_3507280 [Mycena olivaceomarginata]
MWSNIEPTTLTVFHNPNDSTSQHVLNALKAAVIEYPAPCPKEKISENHPSKQLRGPLKLEITVLKRPPNAEVFPVGVPVPGSCFSPLSAPGPPAPADGDASHSRPSSSPASASSSGSSAMRRTLPLRPAADAESAGSGSAYGTLVSSRKCHAGRRQRERDAALLPRCGRRSGACDAAEAPEVILGLILLNEVEVEVEVDEDSEAHQRLADW